MNNPLDKVSQMLFISILLLALQPCLSLLATAYAITSNNNENFSDQFHHDDNSILSFERIATLVVDTTASIYRMFGALGFSFIVAIAVGLTAARSPLASRIFIPIIDILQSVPILGFFPVAIAFFITLFNGSQIGIELAAIFLIFSSMVWNMIFSVYESTLLIPSDLHETSKAFRANPTLLLRRLYLPAITPKLIYNSMMSWSAGWYFLTAAEIISLGSKTYSLAGLGSLLASSVATGQYQLAFAALSTLISVVLLVDFLFWRPLESFANRFRYEYASSVPPTTLKRLSHTNLPRFPIIRAAFPLGHLADFLSKNPRGMIIHQKSIYLVEKITSSAYHIEQGIFSIFHRWSDNRNNSLRLRKLNTQTKTAIAFLGLLSLALFIASE